MRNYLRQRAGAEVLRLPAHIQAARNAALASSRLSATSPFGPGGGTRVALCPAPQFPACAVHPIVARDADRIALAVARSPHAAPPIRSEGPLAALR